MSDLVHLEQLVRFRLRDLVDRDAGHHRDDIGHVLFGDVVHRVLRLQLPFAFGDVKVAEEFLLQVAQPGGFLEVLVLDDLVLRLLDLLDFAFEVEDLLRDMDVREVDPRARLRPARRSPCPGGYRSVMYRSLSLTAASIALSV